MNQVHNLNDPWPRVSDPDTFFDNPGQSFGKAPLDDARDRQDKRANPSSPFGLRRASGSTRLSLSPVWERAGVRGIRLISFIVSIF